MRENQIYENCDAQFTNDEKLVTGELYAIVDEDDVRKQLQKIPNDLKAREKFGTIGASLHYKLPNIFLPAIETPFGAPVKIFD